MKWITSTDIKQWANRRDAQSVLPELVIRLIRATTSNITQIRFPSGDAVHLTGWDGILESSERIYNIDSGSSRECGTNADTKNKANEDYDKRCNDCRFCFAQRPSEIRTRDSKHGLLGLLAKKHTESGSFQLTSFRATGYNAD